MKGPWYITQEAIRDYLNIRCWSNSDLERGLKDLIEAAEEIVAAGKQGTLTKSGHLRYRTGRGRGRMALIVSHTRRVEGDLPQLIAVTRSMA